MYNRRIEGLKLADAINAIEGVPVRPYAAQLSKMWADGKITKEQAREALLMSHRLLAMQLNNNNG